MDAMPPAVSHADRASPVRPVLGAVAACTDAPETLHPALWLGHQLGRHTEHTVPSGFATLDAHLPGGGWPRRVLTELLLPHPGVGEIRLLSACLAATQQAGRLVMVFDPPENLSATALAQLGLDLAQLLIINTRAKIGAPRPTGTPVDPPRGCGPAWERPGARPARNQVDTGCFIAGTDSLWALEQALKSGHVGAVLAWLPSRLRAERLRRLQLAAHAHDGPAFVLREMAAQQRPSAAPLRLALRPGGADVLSVSLLKRRGPPLEAPLRLDLPPVLSASARSRAQAGASPRASVPELQFLSAATFINLG